MSKRKPTISTIPKDTHERRRMNMKMIQNALVIWLDSNIDEENDDGDYHNNITHLQRVVKNINTYTDSEQCIEFIHTIDENNKVCMIISGYLGKHIVPRVHNMSQVDSIFIFCDHKKHDQQWTKDWSKIRGIFTEIGPICEALKVAAQQCEHNSIAISFMSTNGDSSKKNIDRLDCAFMYTEILKNILLTIKFEERHIQEFLEHCRALFIDNKEELRNVNELAKKYHKETPVWWYTCESFLYPMLNTSLRLMNADIIIKMGFFIQDLHRQIEELHKKQFVDHGFSTKLTLYRGQGMSKENFQQMIQTNGGLIAFNNFLSTSKVRDVSLNFARQSLGNLDSIGILFVMTIDPSIPTTPFASVNEIGYFKDQEDEVLFSMHTVFRINDIQLLGEKDRLYQVNLTLTSDNDPDLRALSARFKEEMEGSAEWFGLGELLLKMGESDKAEQVYEILLEQTTNAIDKALIYHKIGWIKNLQGEYEEALGFYEKSLRIREELLPQNHPDLAKSYNNIGLVYDSMGDYSKALSFNEQALEIDKKTLPPNHPDLAKSYGNIGNLYYSMGEYSRALSHYDKSLEINTKTLPPNHPDMASSNGNIGNVYYSMGEYSKALSYYEKTLEINKKSLPPNHPDLASSYNNIGLVQENMNDYSKAHSSYECALNIVQQSLPSDHPRIQNYRRNLNNVKNRC